MTTGDGPEAGLRPEYRSLYRELQTRMSPGGDLAPGDADTFGQFRHGALWTPDRERMHAAILEDFTARCAGMPRCSPPGPPVPARAARCAGSPTGRVRATSWGAP